jgi:integrase
VNRQREASRAASLRWWEDERTALREETPPRPAAPTGLPALRETITSRCGDVVSTAEPLWEVSRNFAGRETTRLNVGRLYRPWELGFKPKSHRLKGIPRRASGFSDELIHAMVLYLANQIEKHSGGHAEQVLHEFVAFEAFLASKAEAGTSSRVDSASLSSLSYQAFARTGKAHGGMVRFYKWCVGRGFPGISAAELLRFRNIPLPSRARGIAIRSRDPAKGALSWEEQQVLMRALRSPTPGTADQDRLITWFFFELGCRPAAVASLRGRHIKRTPLNDSYIVSVPRMKQNAPSNETVDRKISRQLGDLAISFGCAPDEYFVDEVRSGWASAACRRFATTNSLKTTRLTLCDSDGNAGPAPLPLTAYRLRYTLATNLAEQGASPEQIASMLDDRTLAMAMIYTNNTSELVEILEETLDRHPAWLRHVGLFLGRVGDKSPRELPVIQGGVPYFASYERWAERVPQIGWCSNPEPCELRPPLSCYRCAFFIADPDPGAHLQQLEQIKDEIKSHTGIESDRMAKVLRPDLFAISEVIAVTRGGRTDRQRVETKIAHAGERIP